MTIKMIAVDMDGTFLNDQKKYDEERFRKIFTQMNEQSIKFVVASGNQYYQLCSFFLDYHEHISFVAENGAYILEGTTPLYNGEMSKKLIAEVLDQLYSMTPENLIVCGKKGAYVHEDITSDIYESAKQYYPKIKKVSSLYQIDDTIFKFALSFEENTISNTLKLLNMKLAGRLTAVSSGHGDIDLIIPGIHKANGLKLLQERWLINENEIAAFGDSGNDLEMIQHVSFSYAMGNAQPAIKKAAKYQIGDNNTDAVLKTIEQLLKTN